MPEKEPNGETRRDNGDGSGHRLDGIKSGLQKNLPRGRRAARRGIQRSADKVAESAKQGDEIATRLAERAGLKDQLDATRRGVRRSGEVLTGADITRLDEFTDALTRVALGLHRDQGELAARLTQLEQTVHELRREQLEMAELLARLEKIVESQSQGYSHDKQ